MSDDDKPTLNLVDLSTKRQELQQGARMQTLMPLFVRNECLRQELVACIDAVNAAVDDLPREQILMFHAALMRVHGGVSRLQDLLNGIARGGGDAA